VATSLLASRTRSGAATQSGATHSADLQQTLTSPSLQAWLRGDWAILFSHPDDFVRYDLEMDRWLVVAKRAFAERGIRPIALASPTSDPERSWITQVSGDNRSVLLEDTSQQCFGPADLQTRVLREEIEQTKRRFVMIIDDELRQQKIFNYGTLSNLPSPLEFLGWTEALRAKQHRWNLVATSNPPIRERKRGSSREQAGRGAGANGNRSALRLEMTLS
jgi:alkyl hydroperoxide reductase subunit AhpC